MADFSELNARAEEAFAQQAADEGGEPQLIYGGVDPNELTDDSGGVAQPEDTPPETETAPPEADQAPSGAEPALAAGTNAPSAAPAGEPVSERLAQMQAQMDAVMKQNAQLQSMVNELSKKNEEQIVDNAIEMPMLDLDSLAYSDEDEVRRAQTDYAEKMVAYAKSSVMDELRPFIEEAKAGQAAKERQRVLEELKSASQMADLDDMLPAMDGLMERSSILSREDVPLDERLVAAYIMAKGADALKAPAPHEPTVDELMGIYDSNPDFRAAVEQKRLAAVKSGQHVPPLSANGGAGGAALNIKDAPKSLEEVLERANKALRI